MKGWKSHSPTPKQPRQLRRVVGAKKVTATAHPRRPGRRGVSARAGGRGAGQGPRGRVRGVPGEGDPAQLPRLLPPPSLPSFRSRRGCSGAVRGSRSAQPAPAPAPRRLPPHLAGPARPGPARPAHRGRSLCELSSSRSNSQSGDKVSSAIAADPGSGRL